MRQFAIVMRAARLAVVSMLLLQASGLAQSKAPGESTQWTTYSGDFTGQRHSSLTQIGPANVGELRPVWTFQTSVLGKWEASPLVVDGVIYATGPENSAWAIEATTGRTIWRYRRVLHLEELSVCCGAVNRGFALYKDKLLMVTLDAHLVALDIKTGKPVYDVVIDDFKKGYTGTVAPLVVKDKVIVGIAGAEFGIRGFIDAFDADTGKKAWRFWTVPLPGEAGGETWLKDSAQHGGGPTWTTGTYDPNLNLVYWGTGNPSPLYFGAKRTGDNLFTNCLLALNPDSGKLVWWYQFTPHDTHDWDSNHVPVLADFDVGGAARKVVMVANRNGFFYVLDRTNGAFLFAREFAHQTWAKSIGSDGRPIALPNSEPTAQGTMTCPDFFGATNFMSPSFNPSLRLFFVTARETCGVYYTTEQEFVEQQRYEAGGMRRGGADPGYGALRAIDPTTGERKWEFRTARPSFAGTLSTASGLVFSGDMDGNFFAVDASSGQRLWNYQTGSAIYASPITYLVDGKQYVLLGSGTTLTAYALPTPSVTAQSNDVGLVLTAKIDAEGLSQMLIPIRLQGHSFWCSADSGNGRVFSLDITKALNAGLQPNATGTNAGVGPEIRSDQRITGVDVEIGSVVLKNSTIVLGPQPAVVPDIDCVIGTGLLSDYAVEFNYLTPSVRLIPSAQFRAVAAAVSVPMAIDRNARPSTKVRLRIGEGTVEATLLVDTGASYYDVVLLKPFIDANRVSDRIGPIISRFTDTPGMAIGAARAAAVSVGPFDVDGPVTALISTTSGGTYTTDGMLGAGFLRRFTITFDYSRQQLWLEPNGRTRGPQPFDASGIELRPTANHEFSIVAVAADSAASVAALRVGDLLKQIDGRSARDMTLGEIQDAFKRADNTCTVQIEREGRLQTATLHLRRRL